MDATRGWTTPREEPGPRVATGGDSVLPNAEVVGEDDIVDGEVLRHDGVGFSSGAVARGLAGAGCVGVGVAGFRFIEPRRPVPQRELGHGLAMQTFVVFPYLKPEPLGVDLRLNALHLPDLDLGHALEYEVGYASNKENEDRQ